MSTNDQYGNSFWSSALRTILVAWLLAGTLDITAACVNAVVIQKTTTVGRLLQGIASGMFGKETAFSGGAMMALFGLCLHYFIAFCFTIAYFFLCSFLRFLLTLRVVWGLLYGALAWAVMNFIVLPMVFPAFHVTEKNVQVQLPILMGCIGLPLGLIVPLYYKNRDLDRPNL